MIGQTLGHYRVVEKIGQGGMGVVYRAVDERLERNVALKVLPAGALADDDARRRFRKEALALARLNHPNIGSVYEFDSQDGVDFLVMEYISGATLSERSEAVLPEREVIRLGRQLAEGLAAAEKQGIVHRDIKTGNLRVTREGRLKILDFGIAKLLAPQNGADATLTTTDAGAVSGTLPYMAPEQLRGEGVDARTDVYSAGVVLYELASGQRPFPGEHGARLIEAILHDPVKPPSALNPKVSPALENIILKALDKEPERRYQSARELWVDLERLAAPSSTGVRAGAERGKSSTRIWRAVRTHPRTYSVTALAVVIVAVLAWWLVSAQPVLSFAPRDWLLITDFDNQTGDPLFDRSLATALSVSLAQSAHANVFPPSRVAESLRRMGKSNVTRIDEATGREICLRDHIRVLICPAIARVGQQYALSARLIDPRTGATVRGYPETAVDQNHILAALGSIASQIRHDLGESRLATWKQDRPLPQVTTPSLEALKMYADAGALWNKGQYGDAVKLEQSALQLDPDFAMVHADLGMAFYSFIYNDPVQGKAHYEKALELSARTTQRERLYIQTEYTAALGHFDEAAAQYRNYLNFYPDDLSMRYNYAHLLRTNGRQEDSLVQYKEVLRVDPGSAGAYIDVATCYVGLGNLPEALQNYEKAFALQPSWITTANINHEYGFTLVRAGQEEKARQTFEKALAQPELRARGLRSLAWLALYHGKYGEAKSREDEAVALDETHHWDLSTLRERHFLALIDEGMGDRPARLRELERAAVLLPSLPDKIRPGLWLGSAYARSGEVTKAAQALEIAKKGADLSNPETARDLHLLEGEIELARGNKEHAVELILQADREKSDALSLASLARAYQLSGSTDQAVSTHEKLLGLKDPPLGWEPQQDWISGRVQLAKLYVTKGNRQGAASQLSAFFSLWKDADANLPLLKEAQKLQKQLQANP